MMNDRPLRQWFPHAIQFRWSAPSNRLALIVLLASGSCLMGCRPRTVDHGEGMGAHGSGSPSVGQQRPASARVGADKGVRMRVDKNQALNIARQDARTAYRDLDAYDVTIELQDGNWKVDYELKDKKARGGGPHYIISGDTGEILSKRYEQ